MTAIDRANQVVRATIDGISDIEATYYAGDPRDPYSRMPWPLCNAWFEYRGTGLWHCDGPIGHRRVLFHDDFLHSSPLNWHVDADFTTSASTGTGIGVVALAQPFATPCAIYKDVDGFAKSGWIHARVRLAMTDVTGFGGAFEDLYVGFHNQAPSGDLNHGVVVDCQAGSLFQMRGTDATGATPIDGTSYADDTFFDIDIVTGLAQMTVNGAVRYPSVGWVDGNGPTVGYAGNVPSTFAITLGNAGGGATILLDSVTLSSITEPGSLPDQT